MNIVGILEATKWIVGIAIGASIGSIIATKITFRQVEKKWDIDLDETGSDVKKMAQIVKKWDEFSRTEEAEYLVEKIVSLIVDGEKTVSQVRELLEGGDLADVGKKRKGDGNREG